VQFCNISHHIDSASAPKSAARSIAASSQGVFNIDVLQIDLLIKQNEARISPISVKGHPLSSASIAIDRNT
jgi:hypothetical protein